MSVSGHRESIGSFSAIPIKKRRFPMYYPPAPPPPSDTPCPPAKPDPEVNEESKPISQVNEQSNPDSQVNAPSKPDSQVNEQLKLDSQVNDQLKPDSQVINQSKPDSPVTEQSEPDSKVIEQSKPDSQVTEQSKLADSPMNEQSKPDSRVNETLKAGPCPSDAGSSPKEVSREASSSQGENIDRPENREVKLVQDNLDTHGLSLKEPPIVTTSEVDMKGKFVPSDNAAFQVVSGNSRLQLAANQDILRQVKQEVRNEEVARNETSSLSTKLLSTALLLSDKKPLVPASATASRDSGMISEEEKLDPCSWNLALTTENVTSKIDSLQPHTNRSHWDLNTTMETWDGSTTDSARVSERGSRDVTANMMVSSSKSGNTPVALGEKIPEKSDHSTMLSRVPTIPYLPERTEDLLHLRLSSSNLDIPEKLGTESSNLTSGTSTIVKSEPSDVSNIPEPEGTNSSLLKQPVESRLVKSEPIEQCLQEPNKSSTIGNLKSVSQRNVKLEPSSGVVNETRGPVECNSTENKTGTFNSEMHISSGAALPHLVVTTSTVCLPITPEPLIVSAASEFSDGVEASTHSEITTCVADMSSRIDVGHKAGEMTGTSALVLESLHQDCNTSKGNNDIASITRAADNVADPLRSIDHPNSDRVMAESDEEKLNIFGDLRDDCSSDTDDPDGIPPSGDGLDPQNEQHMRCEDDDCSSDTDDPDGIPRSGDGLDPQNEQHMRCEDDDYEDGEVRGSSLHGAIENGGQPNEGERSCGLSDDDMDISDEETNVPFCPSADCVTTSANIEIKDARIEDPSEPNNLSAKGECEDISLDAKKVGGVCLQEPLVAASNTEISPNNVVNAAQGRQLDPSGMEDGLDDGEKKMVSDGAPGASQVALTGDDQGNIPSQPEIDSSSNLEESKCLVLSKSEPVISGAEATKDVGSGGNRSRIINLARALNEPTFNRTKSIPGRSFPSRIERDRTTDDVLSADKLQLRGSRDETSMDWGHKFDRQRTREPVGNVGSEFMHGRGRTGKQMSFRSDWNSNRNFGADDFNSPTAGRFSRHKNMVSRDVTLGGPPRKQLSDDLPSFRHPPARRRSPGVREGLPVTHGVQMVRRPQRNISPDRFIGGDGPKLIGLRHEEKFMRGLPDDMIDPAFSRPQPRYQQEDSAFRHGNRSFSPIQRRGPIHMARMRSKSPGPGARSPGSWSSPRRRSPDGFGRPDIIRRRSPPVYRMERVRSPRQRPCFTEDIVGRRQRSPPFLSRVCSDIREMDAAREHEQPRSFIANRSPTGRVLPRSTRRFNVIDPRERMENDEYFVRPMHPGRFHEIEGDESADERRICNDGRGPVRPFRPPYDVVNEAENFTFDVEGAPRPYRFSPEEDARFQERGNAREGQFDRRVKNRPGNVPRRARSIEGQEENFRHGEQGWQEGTFDDASRVKRRRF